MVKPDLDLWTGTDLIFRVVNRVCILCLIGSRVGSGRVFPFAHPYPKSCLNLNELVDFSPARWSGDPMTKKRRVNNGKQILIIQT
ncbi:hypothetical protein Hanom_Chr17g01590341 [Helianthus anomalus]